MSAQEFTSFSQMKENAQQLVRAQIEKVLQKKVYNSREAQTWTNIISEACVKCLTDTSKNFKYIISTLIVQKASCGLNISGSCFWDSESDGNVSVMWESNTMVCIVNVYGLAL